MKTSGWLEGVIVGECDDDYCTGCEPGCGLDIEHRLFEGPLPTRLDYMEGETEHAFIGVLVMRPSAHAVIYGLA